MYKYETIAQLKAKIIRLLRSSLSANNARNENSLNNVEINSIKLFRAFEFKSKLKRSLIKLICSYKVNSKKYRIPGYLISEYDKKIEVSF